MNSYFVNITENLDITEFKTEKYHPNTVVESIDPIDRIIYEYSKHSSILKITKNTSFVKSFSFSKINEAQMKKEIMELNARKSAGHDEIPPKIIKVSVTTLLTPLTELYNVSVEESMFPLDLKYANVTPFFKNDDNTNKENYRPIRILSSISKIFERLIFQEISSHVSSIYSSCATCTLRAE